MTEPIRCHDCGRFLAFPDLCFSRFHYVPDSHFGPEEAWWSCPTCRDDYGGRDSDRHREADETRSGSVPEGDRARAEGIARNNPEGSTP